MVWIWQMNPPVFGSQLRHWMAGCEFAVSDLDAVLLQVCVSAAQQRQAFSWILISLDFEPDHMIHLWNEIGLDRSLVVVSGSIWWRSGRQPMRSVQIRFASRVAVFSVGVGHDTVGMRRAPFATVGYDKHSAHRTIMKSTVMMLLHLFVNTKIWFMLILMIKCYERKILFYDWKVILNKLKRTWLLCLSLLPNYPFSRVICLTAMFPFPLPFRSETFPFSERRCSRNLEYENGTRQLRSYGIIPNY